MRLTLLKSPIYPNEDADREIHEFVYSLYPHGGDWKKADTIQMAYNLNCPMYYKVEQPHTGALPLELSLLRINTRNVIAEVVKKAEDSGYIIVRVYEAFNRRTSAVLTFCSELSEVWECDLMENNMSKLEILGNTFKFCIQPYEIKTFKLTLK
jgi:alpha-mannosidase